MRFIKWMAPVTLALGVAAFANEELSYEQTLNVLYAEQDGIGLLMDVTGQRAWRAPIHPSPS